MSTYSARAPKHVQRLDPAVRRALLVEAAAEVFQGRDPTEVRVDEVAVAGGVSRSLVYAYFGDRGGLIASVYLHNLALLDAELGWALEQGPPDRARLLGIASRCLRFARDNEAEWNVMAATGSLQHPAVRAARDARIERIAAAWGSGPAARLVAHGVVSLLEAGAQDWVDHHDSSIEAATEVLCAMLWGGLADLPDSGLLETG